MAYRVLLPDDVVPEHYDLALEPDLQKFSFNGLVTITCNVQVATDSITLHARELGFLEASFQAGGEGKPLQAVEISCNVKNYTVALKFEQPLPTGTGLLTIKFCGTLNDQMAGFYRSQYTRADGQKEFLAVTQFEAIDARRCFPCWDEPCRKATFTICLTVPRDLMALSNMPESKLEYLPSNRKRVTFLKTPKMSTYLLAVLVGEFEALQGLTKTGVLLRILAVPNRIAQCGYALDCGLRALEVYSDFFGIPFPLPKMDMVGIPDFASGAMENWGLVTYRESCLLCDTATASAMSKQNVVICITHELAHQWFGNLVTMQWWDDLWLNEGFANWMEIFCCDILNPDWKVWESFVVKDQQLALQLDALRTSHPIQVPIPRAEEVEEVFDNISYSKGGSLVRLLYAVLGHENFQKGLQLYFKRHLYGNTETHDLAQAWEETSGLPIGELITSWTNKMGYPVLRVTKDPFEAQGALEVEQRWFLADGSVQPGDAAVTWVVPLLLGSDSAAVPREVTLHKEKTFAVSVPTSGAQWLKLNYGQHVPCRVLYPATLLRRLSAHLPELPAVDRIGLLSDLDALCRSGDADPTQLVELLKGFTKETNDKVWLQLSICLKDWARFIAGGLPEPIGAAFNKFAAGLVRPVAAAVGWDQRPDDDDNTKALRQWVISLLATFCATDPDVKEEGQRRFDALLDPNSTTTVPADTRCSVMRIAMCNDPTPKTFERLVAYHNASSDSQLRSDIYAAMGWGTPALQQRALAWVLTEDVRAQDLSSLPLYVSLYGREGQQMVFDWTKAQFAVLNRKLGKTSMMLFMKVVRSSGEGFLDAAKVAEVRSFWEQTPQYATVQRSVNQTCETIETNARFVQRLNESALATEAYWAQA